MRPNFHRPLNWILFDSLALFALALFGSSSFAAERSPKSAEMNPAAIYHNYCSVCHGDRGDGRSRASNSMIPPPRDFTAVPELTRDAMITIVTHGKPTTAMVGWTTQLNAKEIDAVVDYIVQTFVVLAKDPRLKKGKQLYVQHCASCHGERGQGSAQSINGSPPPKDLASPKARAELDRDRMIASVTQGRPGTSMAGFASKLSRADIDAVVDYVSAALMLPHVPNISGVRAHGGSGGDAPQARALPTPAPKSAQTGQVDMRLPMPKSLRGDAVKGAKFYGENCALCHGVQGDGHGPRASLVTPKPRNFLDAGSRATLNRPALFNAISEGRIGTEMPAWSRVLDEQELANVAEYVFRQFIRPGGG